MPEAEVETRRIAHLEPPPARLADCSSGLCRKFGLTGELHSTPEYALTQAWAAALANAGFDGIHYLLRHDPGQRLVGVALFGPAGEPSWPFTPGEPIGADIVSEAERRFGVRVVPAP